MESKNYFQRIANEEIQGTVDTVQSSVNQVTSTLNDVVYPLEKNSDVIEKEITSTSTNRNISVAEPGWQIIYNRASTNNPLTLPVENQPDPIPKGRIFAMFNRANSFGPISIQEKDIQPGEHLFFKWTGKQWISW